MHDLESWGVGEKNWEYGQSWDYSHTRISVNTRNTANQSQTNQDKGKAPLNVVQVIPSSMEDEIVVPIQVVTQAQAKENPKLQTKEPELVPAKKEK